MPPTAVTQSTAHRVSQQTATVTLIVSRDGTMNSFPALVTRITPWGLRLAILAPVAADPWEVYSWNSMIRVDLDLPAASRSVRTLGRLNGIALNYESGQPPFVLDLDFPDITEEEEQVLKDSNPLLVIA